MYIYMYLKMLVIKDFISRVSKARKASNYRA